MNIDEYVEEKVNKLIGLFVGGIPAGLSVNKLEGFIRTIIKDWQPKVSRAGWKKFSTEYDGEMPDDYYRGAECVFKWLEIVGVEVNNEVFPT